MEYLDKNEYLGVFRIFGKNVQGKGGCVCAQSKLMKLNPEYELRIIRLSLHSQNHKYLTKNQITQIICFILFFFYGHEVYPSFFSKKLSVNIRCIDEWSIYLFFERKRKFKLIIIF